MIPTLEELQHQCRIDGDHDNSLLTVYCGAARKAVENFINRPLFDDFVPDDCSVGIVITDDIKLAIMMIVGHWYENREPVNLGNIVNEIPLSFRFLVEPYRIIPL
ncbi:head-tail connector protein [Pragia fontium]|uniref:head-tail connector protein n=1 Tax=Pragia fontium TaxID=82985 RepID=UPI00064AE056|nr:head-tail connector protein [Pragia fontium]AKJ41549.1 phage gp6-like head-tail connector family protein [Pragia fontium]